MRPFQHTEFDIRRIYNVDKGRGSHASIVRDTEPSPGGLIFSQNFSIKSTAFAPTTRCVRFIQPSQHDVYYLCSVNERHKSRIYDYKRRGGLCDCHRVKFPKNICASLRENRYHFWSARSYITGLLITIAILSAQVINFVLLPAIRRKKEAEKGKNAAHIRIQHTSPLPTLCVKKNDVTT